MHFLLFCPFFSIPRLSLFENISHILVNFVNLSETDQVSCLLYGYNGLSVSQNSLILNQTIDFIFKTQRFNQEQIIIWTVHLALRVFACFARFVYFFNLFVLVRHWVWKDSGPMVCVLYFSPYCNFLFNFSLYVCIYTS